MPKYRSFVKSSSHSSIFLSSIWRQRTVNSREWETSNVRLATRVTTHFSVVDQNLQVRVGFSQLLLKLDQVWADLKPFLKILKTREDDGRMCSNIAEVLWHLLGLVVSKNHVFQSFDPLFFLVQIVGFKSKGMTSIFISRWNLQSNPPWKWNVFWSTVIVNVLSSSSSIPMTAPWTREIYCTKYWKYINWQNDCTCSVSNGC